MFFGVEYEFSQTTHKKFYTRLQTACKFLRTPVMVTPYMSSFIPNVAVIQEHQSELSQVFHQSQTPRNEATQEVDRNDHEVVEPQPLTPVVEPNTVSSSRTIQPSDFQPIRRFDDTVVSVPTALPPLKKRRTILEATVSPSISSQQDMDFEMANEPLLETFSQQDESIEIRYRAMASCTESSMFHYSQWDKTLTL